MKRGVLIGIGLGICGCLLGFSALATGAWWMFRPAAPKEPLLLRLDSAGPYVILATRRSAESYAAAIEKTQALHPDAERVDFDPANLDSALKSLQQLKPRYALVFLEPEELDVNFAWRWLSMSAQVDDDPFVDVRTGFITGSTPQAAESFVARIAAAATGKTQLPGALVDNLGPAEQGAQQYFNTMPGAMMLPAEVGRRFNLRSISHGKGSFTDDRLTALDKAGLIHFGGHGHPDRIDDGLTAAQVPRLTLQPCVVFNGACYTGVTHRWFDGSTGAMTEQAVAPADSFCLNLLQQDVIAYLAAVHPDHGMPVYQEMEFMACTGTSLGDVMKHTYDGVVLGAGGKLPALEPLAGGTKVLARTPADIMLQGTAARLLLGDPALIVCDAVLSPPFSITTAVAGDALRVTATLSNPGLRSTFTDTYHNDLNPKAPFNDRALLAVDLPADWVKVGEVEVTGVRAGGRMLPHRLVGFAVERDGGRSWLHIQIDVPAQGFQQSALRVKGATVEFVVNQ